MDHEVACAAMERAASGECGANLDVAQGLVRPLIFRPAACARKFIELKGYSLKSSAIRRIENSEYAADFLIQNDGPLVVVFDNMFTAAPFEERRCWGFPYWANKGFNVVGLLESDRQAWYRRSSFLEILEAAKKELRGLSFSRRVGYGGSMGGYAAGAFAAELDCDTCLLLNPISTLHPDLVPFEPRFREAAQQDWSGSYSDAAEQAGRFESLYIVADPLFHFDAAHVKRFCSNHPSPRFYRVPGVGHKVAEHMHHLGVLKWFVDDVVGGEVPDSAMFYKMVRERKSYLRYYEWMLSAQNTHLSERAIQVLTQNLALVLATGEMGKYEAMKTFALATGRHLPEINLRLGEAVLEKHPKLPRLREMMRELQDH
ncbi:hypothetical protein ACFMBG_21140 [Leisingera sp. D0M16]|uniref:hypothetical protein n=1 Tax=Leisingera coralii TaxID=3351347 RepID=UPI003B7B2BA0